MISPTPNRAPPLRPIWHGWTYSGHKPIIKTHKLHHHYQGEDFTLASTYIYRKIPIISPGLIFVQKSFLLGFFSGELILGGGYYWVGLDNKHSLKHYENSLKQLGLKFYGLIFGRAYYRKDFCIDIWGAYFRESLLLLLFFFFWLGGAYYRNFILISIKEEKTANQLIVMVLSL